jgi:ethanolamine ammonia-lyase small subunit
MNKPLDGDVWSQLRHFTAARIGLGRAGNSLPTAALLDFTLAHAQARDAVHTPLAVEELTHALVNEGLSQPVVVHSQAHDRMQYLLRPDLGRQLDEAGRSAIADLPRGHDVVFVICDGLSSIAPMRHVVPLLHAVFPQLSSWKIAPVVVAAQGRVAIGDEIGEMLHAKIAVVLIGERPGLTSPDSMGIYLTCSPQTGRSDAERNCISNVRPEGLPYDEAAHKLVYLLQQSRRLKMSGIALKDDSELFPRMIKGESAGKLSR